MFISTCDDRLSEDSCVPEDAILDAPQLIAKYGYNVEVHFVTTDDGYILELHRISSGPKSPPRKGKKVCLLVHGLFFSSVTFLISGPNHALAYRLVDEGYDVWLANCRGSNYSINHKTLKPFGNRSDRRKFWSFSQHEIGYYDIPATIDYVLQQSEQTKLHYVGHSQGSTAFFIMASERPEYNEKIESMHALAPAVFVKHAKSFIIRIIKHFIPSLYHTQKIIPMHHIYPAQIQKKLLGNIKFTPTFCEKFLSLLMGESDQAIPNITSSFLGHFPTGTGTNQILHFGQLINSGRFRRFNYGRLGNQLHYKQETPPEYNLKNVVARVAIYYGQTDWLTVVKDVQKLIAELPNTIKDYLVPHPKFNHSDFVCGQDAPRLVYDELVKTMKSTEDCHGNVSDDDILEVTRL